MTRAHRPQVADRPSRRAAPEGDKRLSVVIPAYNEAEVIASTVQAVRDVLGDLEGGVEIVVVDDGSTDDTEKEATIAGADQVIRLDPNIGKGAAVRTGALAATGRTVAFTDADLAYTPDQILPLLEQIEAGFDIVSVGCVVAVRYPAEVVKRIRRFIADAGDQSP